MLRGGYDAQIHFLKHQLSSLERVHQLSFTSIDLLRMPQGSYTGTDMERVPDADRHWMVNPYHQRFIDYKAIIPPSGRDSDLESEEKTYKLGKLNNKR